MTHKFWIDRGGTFTDCIFKDENTGTTKVLKLLSSDDAPVIAIRRFLHLDTSETIPACEVRLGTTLVTNTLLENKGARVALVVSEGFEDVLKIGTQARADLFALNIKKRAPLCEHTFSLPLRANAKGELIREPTPEQVEQLLAALRNARVQSVALSMVFGFMTPEIELRLAQRIEQRLQVPVFCGSEASKQSGFLARTATCTLNAYLTPPLTRYLEHLESQLPASKILVMRSDGQLAPPKRVTGDLTLLSGPAGGVMAAVAEQRSMGAPALAFDMGGTSTDVAWIEGQPPLIYETEIGGTPIKSRLVDLHTVAAGGGSICSVSPHEITVGPESAGSSPGPICYQKGNQQQLTITDIQLYLGRIHDTYFPFKLGVDGVCQRLDQLSLEAKLTSHDLALQFLQLAIVKMAEAARQVSSAQGRSAEATHLLVYGGAGGQVACGVANELNLTRIFMPHLAGVYSALGIGLAPESISHELRWPKTDSFIEARNQSLKQLKRAEASLFATLAQGTAEKADITSHLTASVRYQGSHYSLTIPCSSAAPGALNFFESEELLRIAFESKFVEQFGFASATPLQVLSLHLELALNSNHQFEGQKNQTSEAKPEKFETQKFTESNGLRVEAQVIHLKNIPLATIIDGPALILSPTGTLVLESDWQAQAKENGLELLRKVRIKQRVHELAFVPIMAARFTSVAKQMGFALQRSAQSTNIRERLDFSCAVFGPDGALLANAPHIPVHLGAMSESVEAVLRSCSPLKPGQSFMTNDPSQGGSHLPDITVVSPVFDTGGSLRFFTACRGHHSDIGGITPGSMPPFSRSLQEEGVVFSNFEAVSHGIFREKEIRRVLSSGPYPARKPNEVIADLKAQLAANHLGQKLLLEFQIKEGSTRIESAMQRLRKLAATRVKEALLKLDLEDNTFQDTLDDGTKIVVRLKMRNKRLLIDFSGTATSHAGNLNAPKAVTLAAVIYFLRLLVGDELPLNQGCLDPIDLVIPPDSLLNPPKGAAVVAGNVETSQRIVDVLLGASGLAAASQGTMNNLSFGDAQSGYYETIAGGAGATSTQAGASAVHTHMTNTRITDPEELELNFPMRLEEFSIRQHSGGAGRYQGGDGIIRRFKLLSPLTLSLMSQRRTCTPFGLQGGLPGALGENLINGTKQAHNLSQELHIDDEITIKTPGGGGFGTPKS